MELLVAAVIEENNHVCQRGPEVMSDAWNPVCLSSYLTVNRQSE